MTRRRPRTSSIVPVLLPLVIVCFAMLALTGVGGAPAAAQSASEKSAIRTAQKLVNRAHGALAAPGLSEGQRFSRVQSAVRSTFAFSIWEKFLLGKSAKQFDKRQLTRFRKLLPQYLARLYMNQFGKGLRQKPEIGSAKTVRKDVLVKARIPRRSGKKLPVDWRLRRTGGGYKIIDFMVGGTSFLVLKRAEFRSVVNRGGPDRLNDFLERFSRG